VITAWESTTTGLGDADTDAVIPVEQGGMPTQLQMHTLRGPGELLVALASAGTNTKAETSMIMAAPIAKVRSILLFIFSLFSNHAFRID
jgi:hypothetical protein